MRLYFNIASFAVPDKLIIAWILLMSVESRDYDTSSHLKVFVRLRPSPADSSKRCARAIDKGVAINHKDKIYQYYFDGVFDEDVKQ